MIYFCLKNDQVKRKNAIYVFYLKLQSFSKLIYTNEFVKIKQECSRKNEDIFHIFYNILAEGPGVARGKKMLKKKMLKKKNLNFIYDILTRVYIPYISYSV